MTTTKISLRFVSPVLMSFFVMSFCDLVGCYRFDDYGCEWIKINQFKCKIGEKQINT